MNRINHGLAVRMPLILGACLLALTGTARASGVTVTDLNHGVSAESLAQSLVGGGLAISNVTYSGDGRAAGVFSGGTGSIGFDAGVVLSSGSVQTYPEDSACGRGVEGPNNCHEAIAGASGADGSSNSTAFGRLGDSGLEALLPPETKTFDAAVLEFDFVPKLSTVQVSYVFGSEEYSDFINAFNDAFAFFVNGANCALVPGTSEPVSVNTINNGSDTEVTTPRHPELFRDNVRPSPSIDAQMDGLTTVLSCNTTVKAGVSNHMKLVIADSSDESFDSAVFIQASSLASGTSVRGTLSGGGQSGARIALPVGSAVKNSSTLTGPNVKSAGGTVNYKVYSDSACTSEFADAGTKTVAGGVVPDSDLVTFNAPGTYYWQVKYSGDAKTDAGESACGIETTTITPATGPLPGSGVLATRSVGKLARLADLPPPVLGKSVNVEAVSGKVLIALPVGAHASLAGALGNAVESLSKGLKFIPLTEARQIPIGSTLDTSAGVARVQTAQASKGKTQSGDFGAGIFKLLQQRKQLGLTELGLVNSHTSRQVCAKRGKGAVAAKRLSGKVLGRLNASAHGHFTTRGQYSAATVRGTAWSVFNRCDGTLTRVKRGVVAVRDFARRKTITLRAGHTYLARAPRRS